MTEVISVKFKNKGKVYYFDPNGLSASQGDHVIVETAKGMEYAECVSGNHMVEDAAVRPPLRPVIRLSTEEDDRRAEENRRKEREAFDICRQKIKKHGLDMKLVDVEYNFEGNKILFFFTSDGRVDFRELVKDLASVFKTRIELRQIGVRDEARMLGGLGICGKPFCCAQFLDDFQPVSIKMAKTQGLSLNPTKISGTCGRLMCCLKYEQDAYEELVKNVPKVDAFVDTPAGKGSVMDVNLLKGVVRVRLEDQTDSPIRSFEAGEVEVLGGKAKRAEYLALKAEGKIEVTRPAPRFKKPEPVQEQETASHPAQEEAQGEKSRSSRSRRNRQRPHGQHQEEQTQQKAPSQGEQRSRRQGKGQPQNQNQPRQRPAGETASQEPGEHRRPRRRNRGRRSGQGQSGGESQQ